MKDSVNRGLARELITVLRVSGLLKGDAQVTHRTVTIPLAVRPGVPASDVVEAIEAANPQIDRSVVEAISDHAIVQENGRVAVELCFDTSLAAIYHQSAANTSVAVEFGKASN